jgi:small subunit ribosomal protein S20
MANIKSQIKRNKQNEVRHQRNKAVRSEVRTRTKSALAAAAAGVEEAPERLRTAVKRIDKAAAKGVIHPNQAARRKSRLMRKATALAPVEAEEE